jgi:hypothetical protein
MFVGKFQDFRDLLRRSRKDDKGYRPFEIGRIISIAD